MGGVVEDVVAIVVLEEIAIEEASFVVSHDVVLSQSSLRRPGEGDIDDGSIQHVLSPIC